ncbi:hypothetical protein B0181_04795 [Moraxella caviae]|uniref:Uncharacterized protein n=1 Tax=Moraxella caviae TaxID=34060 RepID=A0A1T0A367_9GAMM|nr:hypothetical protein B0181_04795 [Moraxella caviae]
MKLGEHILSDKERKVLDERLNALTDDEIEYTEDMPKLTQEDWDNAITYAQFNNLGHTTA